MKNLFVFTLICLLSFGALAQLPNSQQQNQPVKPSDADQLKQQNWVSPGNGKLKGKTGKKPVYERYFNYYSAFDSLGIANTAQQGTGYTNIHFDSLMVIPQDGDGFGNGAHSVGMVLHPTSSIFNDLHSANGPNREYKGYTNWTLDSVAFPYAYTRPIDTLPNGDEVVDTLTIQIYRERLNDGSATSMITNFFWTGPLPEDTVNFAMPTINRSERKGNAAIEEITVLLNSEDTAAANPRFITEEVGESASNRVGQEIIMATTVTFKPGHPYSNTDTIVDFSGQNPVYKSNSFRLLRYVDQSGFKMKSYNNGLTLLTQQVYYPDSFSQNNPFGTSYFARNNPVNQQGGTSSMIFYEFFFHLTATNTSVPEASKKPLKIGSVYPNPAPANSEVTVNLNLESPQKLNMSLYNSIGQSVKTLGKQNLSKGQHQLNISTNDLDPGVYFLNLSSEGTVQETKKLNVVK